MDRYLSRAPFDFPFDFAQGRAQDKLRYVLHFVPRYSLAREVLEIADRCGYRPVQADCHNFLAELALEEGNRHKAREHAETARERAWCDGPPHRYEAAFQEAERLLERLGVSNNVRGEVE